MNKLKFIDQAKIQAKRVLLRVDFNVSLSQDSLSIANDARIEQAMPTIKYLLKDKNTLILISHLGRPKNHDPKLSLNIVAKNLQKKLLKHKVILIEDFMDQRNQARINEAKDNELFMLENIRYFPEEKKGSLKFAKMLAQLADIYVTDAFAVAHRTEASVVAVPKYLPAYAGLLFKKELAALNKVLKQPKKPVVAIVGGAKINTKINVLYRLCGLADYLLIGGGLANTFFCAQGFNVGKSLCEYEKVALARRLLYHARQTKTEIILPTDVIIGRADNQDDPGQVMLVKDISLNKSILDIGPDTQAQFGKVIGKAKTIVWNGPVGFFENPYYRRGTDFIYYSIAHNDRAYSIVGGGDTLAAISKKEYLDKITHISTGGGAMLEFIEKGTLPGIEALSK